MGNPCLLRQVRQRRPQLLRLCPLRVHALRGVRQKVFDTQKIFIKNIFKNYFSFWIEGWGESGGGGRWRSRRGRQKMKMRHIMCRQVRQMRRRRREIPAPTRRPLPTTRCWGSSSSSSNSNSSSNSSSNATNKSSEVARRFSSDRSKWCSCRKMRRYLYFRTRYNVPARKCFAWYHQCAA